MPGRGGRNPVGMCPRCGMAQGSMSLCSRCAAEEQKERNNWKYPLYDEDLCSCPRIGGKTMHKIGCPYR